MTRSAGRSAPRVGILVLNRIGDDPRVRRQIEAFQADGWEVTAIGLGGSRTPPPPCRLELVEDAGPAAPKGGGLLRRSVGHGLRATQATIGGRVADAAYWRLDPTLARLFEKARGIVPDLWFANDWTVLPIAASVGRAQDRPFVYDTHELATEEFSENWKWRWFMRGLIRRVEGTAIRRAASVSCVSDGIAARLASLYPGLRPLVVRNAPSYRAFPFRPVGAVIRVLYQGALFPGRGLEAAIVSVGAWRDEFELAIRGPGAEPYVASLRALAAQHGVAERVRFLDPVPVTRLLDEAALFDIGLSILPKTSSNNQAALPNKAFEYLMAGLALCVSDLPQLAALVTRHDVGRLVAGEAIAAAVNGFSRDAIDRYKQNALRAARGLSWEGEFAPLLDRCRNLANARR